MATMMAGMAAQPTGDVDTDFAATMILHHQGAVDMAWLICATARMSSSAALRRRSSSSNNRRSPRCGTHLVSRRRASCSTGEGLSSVGLAPRPDAGRQERRDQRIAIRAGLIQILQAAVTGLEPKKRFVGCAREPASSAGAWRRYVDEFVLLQPDGRSDRRCIPVPAPPDRPDRPNTERRHLVIAEGTSSETGRVRAAPDARAEPCPALSSPTGAVALATVYLARTSHRLQHQGNRRSVAPNKPGPPDS